MPSIQDAKSHMIAWLQAKYNRGVVHFKRQSLEAELSEIGAQHLTSCVIDGLKDSGLIRDIRNSDRRMLGRTKADWIDLGEFNFLHMFSFIIRPKISEIEHLKSNESKNHRTRNRRPNKTSVSPLTSKQLEAIQLCGECKGNMSEVARRMGVSVATATQHRDAANKKLGMSAPKTSKTVHLAGDHLGQGVEMPRKSNSL